MHAKYLAGWGMILVFAGAGATAVRAEIPVPRTVEVFTSSERPVNGKVARLMSAASTQPRLQVYELDGMHRVEVKLSGSMHPDPGRSTHNALRRIRQLDPADLRRIRHAAAGLAKAVHYGIDRYPAVVFDGRLVVYGLTDLEAAFQRYRIWRGGRSP